MTLLGQMSEEFILTMTYIQYVRSSLKFLKVFHLKALTEKIFNRKITLVIKILMDKLLLSIYNSLNIWKECGFACNLI